MLMCYSAIEYDIIEWNKKYVHFTDTKKPKSQEDKKTQYFQVFLAYYTEYIFFCINLVNY